MEKVKFTEEEINNIVSLQNKYNDSVFRYGQVNLEEENIKRVKTQILSDLQELKTQENTLIQELTKKYGDGTLNLADGTFEPKDPNVAAETTTDANVVNNPLPTGNVLPPSPTPGNSCVTAC